MKNLTKLQLQSRLRAAIRTSNVLEAGMRDALREIGESAQLISTRTAERDEALSDRDTARRELAECQSQLAEAQAGAAAVRANRSMYGTSPCGFRLPT